MIKSTFLLFSSVEIYVRMSTDLLPTPAKSHYVFNLRDLSKCIQGKKTDTLAKTYLVTLATIRVKSS